MNMLPIFLLLLLPFTLAADQITINVMKLDGSTVLSLQEPIWVSALKERIRAQDAGLKRFGIKLIRDNHILQDTDEITESANVGLITSEVKTISNKAENAWALLTFGKVRCVGNEDNGGRAPKGLEDVEEVVATGRAFAALKSDGSVVAWGDEEFGGRTPEGLEDVKKVVANYLTFVALKSDGSLISWGGGSSGRAPEGLKDVKEVKATLGAFAALNVDGNVISWGDERFGGRAPKGIENVQQLVASASRRAFAALKSDGSIVSWGYNIIDEGEARLLLTAEKN